MPELTVRNTLGSVTVPVDRATYARLGIGLMGLKYVGDAALYALAGGGFLSPLQFLVPAITIRLAGIEPGGLLTALMVLWSVPFLWIGATLSIRRSVDAGLGAFPGLMFFVPVVNLLSMIVLASLPSRPTSRSSSGPLVGAERAVWAAVFGTALSVVVGVGMTATSTLVFGEYGATLFLGTPFIMGLLSAWFFNLGGRRGVWATLGVSSLAVLLTGGGLMLFALEGAICLVMAALPALVLAWMGAVVGRGLAGARHKEDVVAPTFALPLLLLVEPTPTGRHAVSTTIDIAAAPEVVWDEVIQLADIEGPMPWIFEQGVGMPIAARIDGTGVGAVRHAIFTTGEFVEPIRVWDAPRELAFDVVSQPEPMREWSPWPKVHAPHLQTGMISERGQFLLEPLPGGGTRLRATSWYRLQLGPEPYWILWTDELVHAIHGRFLTQIARDAEAR